MMNIVMLSVVMLCVVMLSVVMLSYAEHILSVVAPQHCTKLHSLEQNFDFGTKLRYRFHFILSNFVHIHHRKCLLAASLAWSSYDLLLGNFVKDFCPIKTAKTEGVFCQKYERGQNPIKLFLNN
jgi:hypothetical protein